jgi:RNA polymerase sigma factor (TIGR02999 family)
MQRAATGRWYIDGESASLRYEPGVTKSKSTGAAGSGDDTPPGIELSDPVYRQLKAMAYGRLASQRAGATLNCTALVHETFLKLQNGIDQLDGGVDGEHFLALASIAMRQILVDYARHRNADKRGGGALHLTLQESLVAEEGAPVDLLALDDALSRLARRDADLEQLVTLRFFGGLSMEQLAAALGRPKRSVERDWTRARIYLYRELTSANE